MSRKTARIFRRSTVWFIAVAVCLVGLIGAPLVGSLLPYNLGFNQRLNPTVYDTLQQLDRIGVLKKAEKSDIKALLDYQKQTGRSLGRILRDPMWCKRVGLKSDTFKATWYMSNPYDLLPPRLQEAIRNRKIPFRSRVHVWEWCRINRVPKKWRRALYAALIETTPHNLWRASQGKPPITKNGSYLEPIVIDQGQDNLIIRDGHIATDPKFIPTNSEVLVIVKIQGVDRVLKVEAADIGGAIRGKHVDLPIKVGPEAKQLPHTRLPSKHIRNNTVQILTPLS